MQDVAASPAPAWARALVSGAVGTGIDAGINAGIPGLASLDIFSRIPLNNDSYYFVGAVPCELASTAHAAEAACSC